MDTLLTQFTRTERKGYSMHREEKREELIKDARSLAEKLLAVLFVVVTIQPAAKVPGVIRDPYELRREFRLIKGGKN